MSTGMTFKRVAAVFFLCLAFVYPGSMSFADAASTHSRKKAKKPQAPQLPPLPSGPTGPVQQIPLDSIAPVAPQVSYQNGELTIVAPNSTLGDILRAVRKQTGAEIEVPEAKERVVTHLGPGPARDVMAELLNGSRFNYVLLGSPENASTLTRVVLVAKSGPDNPTQNANGQFAAQPQQQAMMQPGNMAPPPPQDTNDADATDENADDNSDQNAGTDAEQQAPPPGDQPGVKTPQQMLQEMQQRQLQLQQQQQPGQPPVPGPGLPPRPQDQQ